MYSDRLKLIGTFSGSLLVDKSAKTFLTGQCPIFLYKSLDMLTAYRLPQILSLRRGRRSHGRMLRQNMQTNFSKRRGCPIHQVWQLSR